MVFFGENKKKRYISASPEHLLARQVMDGIKNKNLVISGTSTNWYRIFKVLLNHYTKEQISQVIDWWLKNQYDDITIPKVRRPDSFMDRFDLLLARQEIEPIPDAKSNSQVAKIMENITSPIPSRVSKFLPTIILRSLERQEKWAKRLENIKNRLELQLEGCPILSQTLFNKNPEAYCLITKATKLRHFITFLTKPYHPGHFMYLMVAMNRGLLYLSTNDAPITLLMFDPKTPIFRKDLCEDAISLFGVVSVVDDLDKEMKIEEKVQ